MKIGFVYLKGTVSRELYCGGKEKFLELVKELRKIPLSISGKKIPEIGDVHLIGDHFFKTISTGNIDSFTQKDLDRMKDFSIWYEPDSDWCMHRKKVSSSFQYRQGEVEFSIDNETDADAESFLNHLEKIGLFFENSPVLSGFEMLKCETHLILKYDDTSDLFRIISNFPSYNNALRFSVEEIISNRDEVRLVSTDRGHIIWVSAKKSKGIEVSIYAKGITRFVNLFKNMNENTNKKPDGFLDNNYHNGEDKRMEASAEHARQMRDRNYNIEDSFCINVF